LSVSHVGRPVKARPVGFPHQVCGGCVVTAFPAVDFVTTRPGKYRTIA
jgi:hypothetical protein